MVGVPHVRRNLYRAKPVPGAGSGERSKMKYEEKMAQLRSREASLKRLPVQRAARLRVDRLAEDRRFIDRLRFDQSKVWNWNRQTLVWPYISTSETKRK